MASVVESVEKELQDLGGSASESSLGATALALARELDDASNSATSKSMCAKALVEVLREVRALAPPRKENDDLAKLRRDREKRRAGGAAPADSARS